MSRIKYRPNRHPSTTPYRHGFLDFHNNQTYENIYTGDEAEQYDRGSAEACRQFCRSHEVRHRDRSGATIITCHFSPQDAQVEASWRRWNGHPDAEVVYVGQ